MELQKIENTLTWNARKATQTRRKPRRSKMKAKQTFWLGIFIMFLFVPVFLWAQSGWNEEQITSGDIKERNKDIVVDPDGNVHIVYVGDEVIGKGKNKTTISNVYYVLNSNGTWSQPTLLADFGHPKISFGGGLPHVVLYRRLSQEPPYQTQLFYWNPNLNDPIEIPSAGPGIAPDNPDIVAEPNGLVHIAFNGWHDGSLSEIYYTSGTGTSFDPPVAVESDAINRNSQAPSIDVDENGFVGIAFGRDLFDIDEYSVFYTSNASGSFLEPVNINPNGPDDGLWQNWPELEVSNGSAYIFYPQSNPNYNCCANPGRRDLYYVKLNEADGTLLFTPVNFAQRTDNNFDGSGSISYNADKVYLTYWDYKEISGNKNSTWLPQVQYLVLNANDGTVFSGPEVVAENGSEPAIDFNGQAHISFTRQSDVFYATNAGSGPPPPVGTECFIQDIKMSLSYKGNGKPSKRGWTATATVLIHDDQGNPVSGAEVSGQWSELTSDSDIGTTGSDGTVSLNSDKINATGTFTFTVDNVSHSSLTYNPSLNVMTSNSISNLSKSVQAPTETESEAPTEFALLGNYPNPFNPETIIRYQLPESQMVTLTIYNLNGQIIRTLVNGAIQAGEHSVVWDGKDEYGHDVASGVYLYQLQAGSFSQVNKMSLLR